jgi:large subunit ribosomal protein L3
MTKGILGRKVGMTQIYDESGKVIPVTVIQAGPCRVLQIRTPERDGYSAVQLGYLNKPRHKAIRSERGHVANISSKRSKTRSEAGVESPAKAGCEPQRVVRELRGATDGYEVGNEVTVAVLAEVKAVDVVGTSKGRGFAGVIKRHNFSGQRASHGVKKVHRHGGSSGMSAAPSRTFKGKRMAGQYGNTRVTARNIKVIKVDPENHLLIVKGAVPGRNGGVLFIKETNKVG